MNKPAKRERADKIPVERGLAESRTRAQAMIMAGSVFIGNSEVDKPGDMIPLDANVVARGQEHPWGVAWRHGVDHGLSSFFHRSNQLHLYRCRCIHGRFYRCLAGEWNKAYAVDVGRGQLDWKLRQDERVIVLEGTNARYLTDEKIPKWPTSSSAMRVSSGSRKYCRLRCNLQNRGRRSSR